MDERQDCMVTPGRVLKLTLSVCQSANVSVTAACFSASEQGDNNNNNNNEEL